ncbi:MAG: hypothetical protein EP346_08430 [Bacteroidetes bacterium]|nr:MAG: hypothetical protein EP346_08430 [Bacteroidota bacterium]
MNATRVKILLHLAVFAWLFSLWQFTNYGNEEDAYTAVMTAYESHSSNTYVLSRFPGHPVYEYLLRWLYPVNRIGYSLLSIIATYVSFLLVIRIAKRHMGETKAHWVGITFLLTPIVGIMAWQTMEYMLTLAFLLAAWNSADQKNWMISAIFTALATGCRLPSLMYGLPLFILLWQNSSLSKALFFGGLSFILSCVLYFPVYREYGWDFFTTYDLPYPPIAKVVYKATLGTYGIFQLIAIVWAKAGLKWNTFLINVFKQNSLPVAIAFLMSLGSYIFLPEKSAFLIPFATLGWFILFQYSNQRFSKAIVVMSVLGAFTLGTDLSDDLRGIPSDQASFTLPTGNQDIAVMLFKGPAHASIIKAENKINTTKKIVRKLDELNQPALVITGWWYPFIQVEELRLKNFTHIVPDPSEPRRADVEYVYYANEIDIQRAISEGKSIFFTPESEIYNEQRYGHDLVAKYGTPLEILTE